LDQFQKFEPADIRHVDIEHNQVDRRAAKAWAGVGMDFTAVQRTKAAADGKPKTGTALAMRQAAEGQKNLFQLRQIDADPVIADRKFRNAITAPMAEDDGDRLLVMQHCVTDFVMQHCVTDEVLQKQRKTAWIGIPLRQETSVKGSTATRPARLSRTLSNTRDNWQRARAGWASSSSRVYRATASIIMSRRPAVMGGDG
jgi:hypothetical protein